MAMDEGATYYWQMILGRHTYPPCIHSFFPETPHQIGRGREREREEGRRPRKTMEAIQGGQTQNRASQKKNRAKGFKIEMAL